MKNKFTKLTQGYLLIQVLVFGAVGLIIIGGLISWAGSSLKYSRHLISREKALAIAEAGLDYYRWHLAHAPQDFKDGTGQAGPYVHPFFDKDENRIGQFTLTLTAPVVGSTMVTVQSKGEIFDNSGAERTLEAKLAIPSLAKYAMVASTDMRFGEGTEVFGPIHSNGGIRFDGKAHNLITSSLPSYNDPDHSDSNDKVEFGVHTHVNPPPSSGVSEGFHSAEAPPSSVPSRPDVFMAGRQFPVPAVDFTGLLASFATIKAAAKTTSGVYLAGSGKQGYYIVLKTNDTFDVYKVTAIQSPDSNCHEPKDNGNSSSQPDWGSWSVLSKTFYKNYPFPANGLVYVEDNVWVSGQINAARLTITASRDGRNDTSITVNENLLYTNYDGQDVISLIAQDNINVGQYSADTLRIDAALVAKDGRVGRYYYDSSCDNHARSTITLYGMIVTNERYGFAYTDDTGYQIRNIIYDGNFLYGPPPSFPLTTDQYQTISWREI